MAQVTVRFFARYAELAGCDSAAVSLAGTTPTVADVLERVRADVPGARAIPARPLTAVNLRQVQLDAPVRDGDEIALLPPLSGG